MKIHNQNIPPHREARWALESLATLADRIKSARQQHISAANVELWLGWKFYLCLREQLGPVTKAFPCDEHEYQSRDTPVTLDMF